MQAKKVLYVKLTMSEAETRMMLRALQGYHGNWHDLHGFRWRTTTAKKLNDQLCAELQLDPTRPEITQ